MQVKNVADEETAGIDYFHSNWARFLEKVRIEFLSIQRTVDFSQHVLKRIPIRQISSPSKKIPPR